MYVHYIHIIYIIYVHTYIHIHTYIHVHVHVVQTYIYIYIYMHTYIHMHTYMYEFVHVCVHVCTLYQYPSCIERYVCTEHFCQYVTGGGFTPNRCHFFEFYNLSRINSVCSSDFSSVTSERSLSVTP